MGDLEIPSNIKEASRLCREAIDDILAAFGEDNEDGSRTYTDGRLTVRTESLQAHGEVHTYKAALEPDPDNPDDEPLLVYMLVLDHQQNTPPQIMFSGLWTWHLMKVLHPRAQAMAEAARQAEFDRRFGSVDDAELFPEAGEIYRQRCGSGE